MRRDFSQLTPEALAALSNWGLVKRAQREPKPALEEADGVLRAAYPDGVVCTFPSGSTATQGSCSCLAPGWCRHLVGALLACSGDAPELDYRVDPKEVCRLLGPRLSKKAEAVRARGLTLQVLGPPWEVRLPGCTVRFLVGGQAGYCKCDCEAEGPCEHWALAAWAVEQREGQPGPVLWQARGSAVELAHCRSWLEELLQAGCAQSEALWKVWGPRLSAEVASLSWIRVLVEEVRALGQAYAAGSTVYSAERWLFCLLSLAMRLRASGHLLGGDVLWEQELEHTRLSCLGCRLRGAGAELYWADAGGQVLLQRIESKAHSLGPLQEVARSQVVSRGVVRRADGSLRFRRDRRRHSLAPLDLDWRHLPAGLIWPGDGQSASTALLEPPLAARDFWVVPLAWAEPVGYDAGAQALLGRLGDLRGGELQLRLEHRADSPGALDALAANLEDARWIAGFVRQGELEPVGLGTDSRMVVLDLEQGCAPFDWPLTLSSPSDPLSAMLAEGAALCEGAAQLGLSQLLPSFQKRRQELAERLQEAALFHLSRALSQDWCVETFWGTALRCRLAVIARGRWNPSS